MDYQRILVSETHYTLIKAIYTYCNSLNQSILNGTFGSLDTLHFNAAVCPSRTIASAGGCIICVRTKIIDLQIIEKENMLIPVQTRSLTTRVYYYNIAIYLIFLLFFFYFSFSFVLKENAKRRKKSINSKTKTKTLLPITLK